MARKRRKGKAAQDLADEMLDAELSAVIQQALLEAERDGALLYIRLPWSLAKKLAALEEQRERN